MAETTAMRRLARACLLAVAIAGAQLVPTGVVAAQDAQVDPGVGAGVALLIEETPSSPELRAGAEDAAAERGISLDIHAVPSDRSRQMSAIARLHDEAGPAGLAGLIVAVRAPADIAEAIEPVVADGVPVVIVGQGLDAWQSLGAIGFVGQDETLAGAAAGDRLVALGVSEAICVRDVALDDIQASRCQAAEERMAAAGATLRSLFALDPPGDPTGVRDAITARLISDPSIGAVLATEEDGLAAAIEARDRAERPDLVIATFEPDAGVLADIEAGRVRFAVDQRPDVQGYLSVVTLSLADGPATLGAVGPIIIRPRIVPGAP